MPSAPNAGGGNCQKHHLLHVLIDMAQLASLFPLPSESAAPVKGANYDSRPTPGGISRTEKGVIKDRADYTHPSLGAAKG